MRILITGGAGFIGSHLVELLLNDARQVTVIDNLSTGSMRNVQLFQANSKYKFVYDTIENANVLDRLVSEADQVVHLAAAVGVRLIIENPVSTLSTNVMGTEIVLKTCLRYRVPVLLASTSEVYGKGVHVPFEEGDDVLLGPTTRNRWGYAASKMMDEFMAIAYYKQYDLPVRICRLFNTVGPRQMGRYGMVLPRFVYNAIMNEPIPVYGDGEQTRCFCNVKDTVRGLKMIMDSDTTKGEIYNVGSEEEVSINSLATEICRLSGSRSLIENIPYKEIFTEDFEDMERRVPSIAKIRSAVGWTPNFDLQDIIVEMIDYVKHNNQVEDYLWH